MLSIFKLFFAFSPSTLSVAVLLLPFGILSFSFFTRELSQSTSNRRRIFESGFEGGFSLVKTLSETDGYGLSTIVTDPVITLSLELIAEL